MEAHTLLAHLQTLWALGATHMLSHIQGPIVGLNVVLELVDFQEIKILVLLPHRCEPVGTLWRQRFLRRHRLSEGPGTCTYLTQVVTDSSGLRPEWCTFNKLAL